MSGRLLAWCAGATVGYVVGWLAGQSTRDALALRSLSRPETGASVHRRRSEPLAGSQAVEGRSAPVWPQEGEYRERTFDPEVLRLYYRDSEARP